MNEKINNWFLENEGVSYKEFCRIYNNGEKVFDNLSFTFFPKYILTELKKEQLNEIERKIPKKLRSFLEENNFYKQFLNMCKYSRSIQQHPNRLKYNSVFNWLNFVYLSDSNYRKLRELRSKWRQMH